MSAPRMNARFLFVPGLLFIAAGVAEVMGQMWSVNRQLEAMHTDPAKASGDITGAIVLISIGLIFAGIGCVKVFRKEVR